MTLDLEKLAQWTSNLHLGNYRGNFLELLKSLPELLRLARVGAAYIAARQATGTKALGAGNALTAAYVAAITETP